MAVRLNQQELQVFFAIRLKEIEDAINDIETGSKKISDRKAILKLMYKTREINYQIMLMFE